MRMEGEIEIPASPFLGEQREEDRGKKTLVLDLDETLVHSTFQCVDDCQYVIPVEIEGECVQCVRVPASGRPGVHKPDERDLRSGCLHRESAHRDASPRC